SSTASSTAAKFKAGSYEGTGAGYGGELKVNVTLTEDKIESIDVTTHSETEGIGTMAIDALPAKIVEAQSLTVDAISGATVTSNAIIEATTAALTAAGADMTALSTASSDTASTEAK
ncbi:MAG: FMN-binding protein, partial [Angelakisella sp.]